MTKKEHQRSIARIIKAVEDRDVLLRAQKTRKKIQSPKSKREKLKKGR
jgi:hypothetical protein